MSVQRLISGVEDLAKWTQTGKTSACLVAHDCILMRSFVYLLLTCQRICFACSRARREAHRTSCASRFRPSVTRARDASTCFKGA
eukprot:scaffold10764_cov71-Phaeocystis_antarctica.AAC.1